MGVRLRVSAKAWRRLVYLPKQLAMFEKPVRRGVPVEVESGGVLRLIAWRLPESRLLSWLLSAVGIESPARRVTVPPMSAEWLREHEASSGKRDGM